MKTQLLYASIAVAAGLAFVNLYNSLVDVKSWGSDIPSSILITRSYFKAVNPSVFFRLFSPVNQMLSLACLLLFWKSAPSARPTFAAALLLYILADVFTFAWFYPRNAILFTNPTVPDQATLENIWRQWSRMNWLRTAIVFAGLLCSMISLHRVYRS